MSFFFVFLQMLFSCKKYAKKLGEIPCGKSPIRRSQWSQGQSYQRRPETATGRQPTLAADNNWILNSIPFGKLSLVFQQLGIQIPFGNGEMFVV